MPRLRADASPHTLHRTRTPTPSRATTDHVGATWCALHQNPTHGDARHLKCALPFSRKWEATIEIALSPCCWPHNQHHLPGATQVCGRRGNSRPLQFARKKLQQPCDGLGKACPRLPQQPSRAAGPQSQKSSFWWAPITKNFIFFAQCCSL